MGATQEEIYASGPGFELWHGDCAEVLAKMGAGSADACVTSPPYLDARPEYDSPTLAEFGVIFEQLARVVTGPCLVNVGRVFRNRVEVLWWPVLLTMAAQSGWGLIDTLVWTKPNANPIRGRVFADSHEYVLILGRAGVTLNVDGIRRPYADSTQARFGRAWTNHRGVKNPIASKERHTRAEPNPLGARPRSYIEFYVGGEKGNPHPAPMAPGLAEHLVSLATWPGQTVLDPFAGSGNTARAARKLGRNSILIEQSEEWAKLCADRLAQPSTLFDASAA